MINECMLNEKLKQQVQDKVSLLFHDALRHEHLARYKGKLKCPSLLFSQRGKIAASARLQPNIININALLYEDNVQYFLDTILAHELAHILVHQCYAKRVKPHGPEWQIMMTEVFQLPAQVTHTLDVSKVARKGFTYACDCGEIELSVIRHNRVQRKEQSYLCRKCRQTLSWQSRAQDSRMV